ncbi:unnamed protein product [Periconia digitata]|uniref:CFEM domain-containing protein n=1 Tax=Periconia digitata TaxID=1303443 RepID=A0A9W4XDD2_9PLEO|nr:unnamed protein product [Periconia digitata]
MKTFAVAALVSLAGVATAQLDNIPTCALSCFLGPLSSDGCSELTDFKCHCEKFDTLVSGVTPCVQKACEASDQEKVISGVVDTCKAAGVSVTPPTLSSSAPSSSAAPSSAMESMTSMTSSAMGSITTSASLLPTSVGNSTGPAPTGGATTPPPTFPGAASGFVPGVGAIGAAVLAFFAL